MNYIEKFLQLIKDNPDLPIVPVVDSEVVADDSYNSWVGKWGDSYISEYYIGQERIHFKDDDEEDVLCDLDGCIYGCDSNGIDIYNLSDEEWNDLYASIKWTKAIIVYVTV